MTIVDLAAAAHSTSSDRDRGRVAESRSINASMSTFKACIVALSAHRQFVPVMESKLTRVLRDVMACAGCMTTFVACVSEMAVSYCNCYCNSSGCCCVLLARR